MPRLRHEDAGGVSRRRQLDGIKIVNLSGLTPRTTVLTPTDATLADDTAVDGVLGDRLRLKITSTGTFGSGSVISARIACR